MYVGPKTLCTVYGISVCRWVSLIQTETKKPAQVQSNVKDITRPDREMISMPMASIPTLISETRMTLRKTKYRRQTYVEQKVTGHGVSKVMNIYKSNVFSLQTNGGKQKKTEVNTTRPKN